MESRYRSPGRLLPKWMEDVPRGTVNTTVNDRDTRSRERDWQGRNFRNTVGRRKRGVLQLPQTQDSNQDTGRRRYRGYPRDEYVGTPLRPEVWLQTVRSIVWRRMCKVETEGESRSLGTGVGNNPGVWQRRGKVKNGAKKVEVWFEVQVRRARWTNRWRSGPGSVESRPVDSTEGWAKDEKRRLDKKLVDGLIRKFLKWLYIVSRKFLRI